MPIECRLLVDPPAAGDWNMALDETLLEWAIDRAECCWRFYQWARPTLSLGYFQDYALRAGHAPSRDCDVVRRLTGGGAILHDAELTYSLAVPPGHALAAQRDRLYAQVHASMVEGLADLGLQAAQYGDRPAIRKGEEPFLCFLRRTTADVVVVAPDDPAGDRGKIAGSAQRRRRGAVLQHGSLILARSDRAPEIAGLREAGCAADVPALIEAWLPHLSDRLGLTFRPDTWTDPQQDRARHWVAQRYGNPQWTIDRR